MIKNCQDDERTGEKIMVVSGCSKSKLIIDENTPVMAKKLYTGQLFQGVRKFAELHHYDFYCISGKYGLIPGDREIKTYNQKIKTSEDSIHLYPLILNQTNEGELFQSYDNILLVMGREYRAVFGELLTGSISHKFITLEDKRGLFGYKQIIATLVKLKFDRFDSLINKDNRVLSMDSLNRYMSRKAIFGELFAIEKNKLEEVQ